MAGKAKGTKKGRSKKGAAFDGQSLDFGKDPSVVQKGNKITLTFLALTEAERKVLAAKFPGMSVTGQGGDPPRQLLVFKSKKEALRCYALMESDDSPFPSTLQVGTCYSCDEMIFG